MRLRYDDAYKARQWPKEHWGAALFLLGVLAVLVAVLVALEVLSEAAGVAGFVASVVYVVLTTWRYTRGGQSEGEGPGVR